eukprot:12895315-Ditylum_brightwellii.AAC.1
MEFWRANMDIQLILDAGKVAEYMTKYVTKPERDMPISLRNMICRPMMTATENGQNVQSTLQYAIVNVKNDSRHITTRSDETTASLKTLIDLYHVSLEEDEKLFIYQAELCGHVLSHLFKQARFFK